MWARPTAVPISPGGSCAGYVAATVPTTLACWNKLLIQGVYIYVDRSEGGALMTNRIATRAFCVTVSVLLLSLVACTAAPMAPPTVVLDTPSPPCTDEEAMDIIRAFVGRPDLALTAHGAMSETRSWEHDFAAGPGGIFTVDVERRAVVIAIMPPGLAGPGGTLDCDQAQQVAREFAAARVQGFDRLTLLYDTLADHGAAGGQHCEFRWGELLGAQKARGIQFVAVSVDGASGSVVDFHQVLPVPITVGVEPKLSRERALAIAKERFGVRVTESTADLSVWWRYNDRTQGQVLRWQVTLQSDEPISEGSPILKKAAYTIDAHTGDVLEETR